MTTVRQPGFSDNDLGLYIYNGSSWVLQPKDTPVIDVDYSDGGHDGFSYIQTMVELTYVGEVTGGSRMVREVFTPVSSWVVAQAWVRVRRDHGTDPLILSLCTIDGSVIGSVTVPSTAVPQTAAGSDNGGAVWCGGYFSSTHILVPGTQYMLRLSCGAATKYTAAPVRQGDDSGMLSFAFREGSGQRTTDGSTWSDLYAFSPVDIQFYFL